MFNFVSQTCHNTLQNYLKLQGYMLLYLNIYFKNRVILEKYTNFMKQ